MDGTREADFGGILGETTALVGDNSRAVILFIAVIGGLAAVGELLGLVNEQTALFGFDVGFRVDQTDSLAGALFKLLSAVVSVVGSYLLVQTLLAERGRLCPGGTRIWAYVGLSILTALGVVLGFILIVVPGIILMVRWAASPGYLIGERVGVVDSLQESWRATDGHGWPIFFAGLVLVFGVAIAGAVLGGVAGLGASESLVAVVSGIAGAVGSVLSLAFGVAVYLLVSDATAEIEAVFA